MAVVRSQGTSADITFRVGTLDESTLEVAGFEGRETISRLFHFSLDLVSRDAWIDFDEVIGQAALLTVHGDPAPRHVSAIVCRFEQAGRGTDFTRYRAELVPAVWLLTQRKNCCIFQNLSVPDIIRQVFERANVPSDAYRFAVRGDYGPRDYCVQYRESDMEFAARLLEEEGIFFFFEHSESGHVLVMADHADAHPVIVEPETVRLAETGYGVTSEEFLSDFRFTREIRTGAVATRDYNFTRSSRRPRPRFIPSSRPTTIRAGIRRSNGEPGSQKSASRRSRWRPRSPSVAATVGAWCAGTPSFSTVTNAPRSTDDTSSRR